MAYKFVTVVELNKRINDENEVHEEHIETLDAMLQAVIQGDTLFHEEETDKWYLVPKGQSIPPHLQNEILGRG